MPPYDRERRRRRNRRLSLLGLIVVVIVGAAVTAYAIQRNRTDAAMQQRVTDSAIAFKNSEFERVVELLEDRDTPTNTLRRVQGDPDALWHYVQARQAVPMDNGEHIGLSLPALRQVVSLDPGNLEAGQMLLGLLMGGQRNTEALDIATRLVAAHPKDVELLRMRGALNMMLDNHEEAFQDALAASQIEPLDVRTQMDVASLMRTLHRDPTDFFNRATALHNQHPGDPRAEIILARANLLLGDLLEADRLVRVASDREPPDDDFVRIMVTSLDMLDRFPESYAYLQRVAGDGIDGPLESELFLREFEALDDQRVVERASRIDAPTAEPNVLAIAAISHYRLGDPDQARTLARQLEARTDNPLAQHWATVLHTWWATPAQPGELVQALVAACADNPNNPYLHYQLAEAYRALGERESALVALDTTQKHRPSWAHPYYLEAELLLELDRPADATLAAQRALKRRSVPAYAASFAVAQARAANAKDALAVQKALNFIDERVLSQFPDEPRSLVAAIELLARANQPDAAADRTRAALERDTVLPQATLLELAAISRTYRLGMEPAIFARAESAYGSSPRVALDQAMMIAQRSSNEEAVALFESAMPDPPTLHWRVAQAQLADALDDPDAFRLWIRLANDYPDQLDVQRLALASVGVTAGDGRRAFADQAINRMRELAGEDSIGWKVERARYLLGSENPAASARAASELLQDVIAKAPNRVEPYRLLARCQQLRGDDVAATRSIEQAAALAPDNMWIQYQLGELLHRQQNFIQARRPLFTVASNDRADYNLRLNALILLSRNGNRENEVTTLIPILERMQRQYNATDQQQMLLGNLYLMTGREQEVDELCERMLENPTPDIIDYTAAYYWQTGRAQRASEIIAMVDDLDMPEEVRHNILAWHAHRTQQPDQALSHFRDAARAAPSQSRRWQTLVTFDLTYGRPELAVQDARQALEHLPDNATLKAVVANADLLNTVAVDVRFRPMAVSVVANPEYREVGIRALRLIDAAARNERSTGSVARDLVALANDHTGYLPLQNLTAALLLNVRQFELAGQIATRTMESNPTDGFSARLATQSLVQTGDWRRATTAAQSWGRRIPSDMPLADVYISMCQRNLNRVKDALATLEPYITPALASPEANTLLLGEYAAALVQDGQIDVAWRRVLEPNLGKGPAWRQLAMDLAGGAVPSARAASAWLGAVEAAIPADAPVEQLMLAQANFQAGDRLRDNTLIERARVQIVRATDAGGAPAGAWFLRGRISDRSGDLQNAEASYRMVLSMQPNDPLAQNNLAMVLVALGRNLNEAVQLARAASATSPDDMNLRDTLAQTLSRVGEHEEAIRIIERVIQEDRQNMDWVRTKAKLLDAAGRRDEAERLRETYNLAD
ncbi:MAG: tetratricopeptide repeat protein [Phycisphaerales bacterium JB063]